MLGFLNPRRTKSQAKPTPEEPLSHAAALPGEFADALVTDTLYLCECGRFSDDPEGPCTCGADLELSATETFILQ